MARIVVFVFVLIVGAVAVVLFQTAPIEAPAEAGSVSFPRGIEANDHYPDSARNKQIDEYRAKISASRKKRQLDPIPGAKRRISRMSGTR
jgi:hypothetical protein